MTCRGPGPRPPERLEGILKGKLGQLGRLGPFVAGCLVCARVRCGEPGCGCASGPGHASWRISRRRNGVMQTIYVRRRYLAQVERWVRRYHRLKRLVREISELTVELLRAQTRAEDARRSRDRA